MANMLFSSRGEKVSMCHFKENENEYKNIIFDLGVTEPPFRANLLFGMLKVILSEPPFRDQP